MIKYLPIGSIVKIKAANKPLMIYGRLQIRKKLDSEEMYDYIACTYPEGSLSPEKAVLFNHDQIIKLIFLGYQDDKEFTFKELLEKEKKKYLNQNK